MKSLHLTLTAVLLFTACSDVRSPTQATPTPTPAPQAKTTPTTPVNGANWIADATVLSSTGGGCGWGTAAGDTRSGVLWRITQTADSVTLDEDMPNWPTDDIPYSGSLSGSRFIATEVEPGLGVCQFRGGDLSGSFSEDGLHFEASETLRWGSAEHPTTVQRHWTGRRL
jgi:hypothetical protein